MGKEILRIKIVENGITVRGFFMNFREWRKVHRKGGGSPYVVKIDDKTNIEISLRDEKMDALIERRFTSNEKEG